VSSFKFVRLTEVCPLALLEFSDINVMDLSCYYYAVMFFFSNTQTVFFKIIFHSVINFIPFKTPEEFSPFELRYFFLSVVSPCPRPITHWWGG